MVIDTNELPCTREARNGTVHFEILENTEDPKIKLLADTLQGVLVADGVINDTGCSAPELIAIAEDYITSKKK